MVETIELLAVGLLLGTIFLLPVMLMVWASDL